MKVIKRLIMITFLFLIGCASARMERIVTETDGTENIVKVSYNVLGKRSFHNLKINPKTGLVELGDSKGSAGDIGAALKNSTEIMKRLMVMP